MNDIAVCVENISKRYRIGKSINVSNNISPVIRKIAAPFQYLADSLRKPSADEIIWAVDNVSFNVKYGEVLGIIGRNGAGKSTLLKILSRITEPTSGKATIHGRVGALLEVGTGFHPELTGRENIHLSGAILGMHGSEIDRKFDEIVTFSGVEKFIDTPVKYYSTGMKVRLGFAVAAHLEPEILFIDEVLAVGDAEFQNKCLGKMSDIASDGRTILFISHNMAAVQSLCSRGIFMQQGSVLVDGLVSEAVSAYLKAVENLSEEDLLERKDRGGKGFMRLIQVEISDTGTSPSSILVTGGQARFVFYLNQIPPGMNFEYVDFTIYDLQGRPIAYFNSADRGSEDFFDPSLGTKIVCEIEELTLLPGRYRLNVGIKGNGDLQDHVEAAAFFNVEEGHVRGRPVARSQRLGNVIFPHRWAKPALK